MISINNISVSFSGNDLFKEVSLVINERDRIGLVGKNGVGKSTLLKIILGLQQPDGGVVVIPDGRTVGYLPQEMHFEGKETVWTETLKAYAEINSLKKRDAEIQVELTERTDYESDFYQKIIDELGNLHMRLELIDDGKSEQKTEQVLLGLGFPREDFQRKMSEFSGGWQMRVELAKLILMRPDLLLLDEPTNHLDIDSILWLEQFFQEYPGAIMMISHDRMFLDNITNRTVEIIKGKIYDYSVSYSKFFQLRQERIDQQKAAYDNQQKYISQQERFIERFKAKNTKAKQAQSKMKQLEKLDRVHIDETDDSRIRFHFPAAQRSGDVVLKARDLSKTYGDHTVFSDAAFDIFRGERVAFVGRNGQGKSTLVKLIVGDESGVGELKLGHNVEVGYYAQIQEKTLNQDATIEEIIQHEATGDDAKIHRVRGLLGAFLFGPDDYGKKVKVLSGGEKSRLALAKMLLKQCNLLILDEPTNHLDIGAKEVLKEALQDFKGTLILVSHDREFLQGLTDRTFEFKDGRVKEHLGTIDDFLSNYKVQSFREFEGAKAKPKPKAVEPKMEVTSSKPAQNNGLTNQQRKEKEKEWKRLKNQLSNLEQKIELQEKEMRQLEEKMANPTAAKDSQDIFFQHAEIQRQLDDHMKRWEHAGEEFSVLSQLLDR
ncbi:MAG: ABC-F family ATP-binding cassette domain-containing protein [Flavobacteriales bacterium]|nr:ABC-F family ATP-binding cassette domain-containing protein [Flavobacteriales bacterium]